MPLKSDFDRTTHRKVIAHALAGAILGLVPGAVVTAVRQTSGSSDELALTLMEMGCVTGVLVGGLAASAATIVAAIRSRGTGPGKTDKLKDYHRPEPFPTAPGPTRRPEPTPAEQPEPPLPAPPSPPPPPAATPPAPLPTPPAFVDYDQHS